MIKSFTNWLDDRTGYRGFVKDALYERIPGGAKWRYVWGSTLVFAFVVQMITGTILWMAYSPSSQTAWESVYYIQHEMAGGWLLRGIHHYMAQAMIVLLALHVMQVVIDGAYRAPREVNFWIGIILLLITMGLGLTGYLLPWDQKGYWATKVATNIAGSTPVIGPYLQKLVIGGSDYGHHTLTRFFALHAGVLPAALIGFLVIHVYVFRRHGITAHKPEAKRNAHFWPDQILRDGVACLAVLLVVLFLSSRHWIGAQFDPDVDPATVTLGADLGPPAEPTENYDAARPEWYYLSLYQLLKYVPEFVGAFIVPGVALGILFLMPILGKWKLGHRFNIAYVVIVLLGAGALTGLAIYDDQNNPSFKAAVTHTSDVAQRTFTLIDANDGIPVEGATGLMHNDPQIMGPRLFREHCAACHRYDGHDGTGYEPLDPSTGKPTEPSAADLYQFASVEWLTAFLDPDQITKPHMWGNTRFVKGKDGSGKPSRMVDVVVNHIAKYSEDDKKMLAHGIEALSAGADLPYQAEINKKYSKVVEGKQVLDRDKVAEGLFNLEDLSKKSCTDCHELIDPDPGADSPTLIGYGSKEWLVKFIGDPEHAKFYGDKGNDRMPSYARDGQLTTKQIELLADWIRGDGYDPKNPKHKWPWVPKAVAYIPPKDTTVEMKSADDIEADNRKAAKAKAAGAPKTDNGNKPDTPPTVDKPDTTDPPDTPPTPTINLAEAKKAGPAEVPDTIDFVKHVQPIFEANCVACHGPVKPKGKYRMDIKSEALKTQGGGNIVPGDVEESWLAFVISVPADEDDLMPPTKVGGPMTKVQIDVIRKWIEQGAKWPDGVELKAKKDD